MNVDSISNVVNLKKLCNRYPKLIGAMVARDNIRILTTLNWCSLWDIHINYNVDKKGNYYSMTQLDFFSFIDLIALVTMKIKLLERQILGDTILTLASGKYDYNVQFDDFDVQPFREHLFNSNNVTYIFEELCQHLDITDDNCVINNFRNEIEFKHNFKELLELIGNIFLEYEYLLEDNMLEESPCLESLDWMLKRQKFQIIFPGKKDSFYRRYRLATPEENLRGSLTT